jgi:hypothetical protein
MAIRRKDIENKSPYSGPIITYSANFFKSNVNMLIPLDASFLHRMKLWIYLFLVVAGPMLSNCAYESEEELFPQMECETASVSYSKDILMILENNCYICHASHVQLGGIELEGYDNLKRLVDSGFFIGAVTRMPGFSPMPKGQPPLPDCQMEKIKAWVQNGALNN